MIYGWRYCYLGRVHRGSYRGGSMAARIPRKLWLKILSHVVFALARLERIQGITGEVGDS